MRCFSSIFGLFLLANMTIANAGCDFSVKQQLQLKVLGGLPLNAASTSMYPTLPPGSIFFARTVSADGPKLARGDIVAVCLQHDPGTIYIKRIIGLPGDRVQLADNEVVLNGAKLPRTPSGTGSVGGSHDFPCFEERTPERAYHICQIGPGLTSLSNMKEVTVPAGELFVLGDNRDNSVDSRLPSQMGPVLIENVIGIIKPSE